MESILGKILASAMICAVTGGDPEVESRKCAEEIANQISREMDTDVTISYCHKKGTDGAEIHVEGRGACIITGLYNLVGNTALRIAGNKEKAMKVIEEVYEGAKSYVDNQGGYKRCAGLC